MRNSSIFNILVISAFCLLCFVGHCQQTTITATVTDSDSTVWTDAQWKVQFVPAPNYPNLNSYFINGTPLTSSVCANDLVQSGTSNHSTGAISTTLCDNTQITPLGSQFVWTIQSNTSAAATQYLPLTISGSSMNLSSYLSLNSNAPRIKIGNQAGIFAYADIEITNTTPGNFYWNVVTLATRQCAVATSGNCSVWQNLVTSSWNGGTVTNPVAAPSFSCTGSPSTCYTGNLAGNVTGNATTATTATTATHALNLPADLATQSAAAPNTASFTVVTPTVKITDWQDTSNGCHLYRGIVNVADCGAVADGAFVTNGCGAGSNCWKSQGNLQVANNTAIRAAITAAAAAGTTGGIVFFPPSGNNTWIVGGSGTCTQAAGDGAINGIFTVPNNVTIQGAGKNTTVVMMAPGTATTNCAMFVTKNIPSYGILFQNFRIDGNEPTDSTHNDILHPDNNNSTGNSKMGAYYIVPGTIGTPGVLDIASTTIQNTQITGFTGLDVGESGTFPNIIQFVIWSGPYGFVKVVGNSIYNNQWGGAIFNQSSDSLWIQNYFVQNGNWDTIPTAVEWNNGGNRWESNYFGGGFATNFIGFGVFGDYIANNINDFPGPGNATACAGGASGCGNNWEFVDGLSSRYSTSNTLINNGASDTYAGYPAVSFAGHSSNNTLIGMQFYIAPSGPVPTYLIQEKDLATYTTVINPIVSETPSISNWLFGTPANSYVLGANGATDTYTLTATQLPYKTPQIGTPTVGQAACIKASGPPVVIGYCSTTPTLGTCTCN